jgi:tetratricopeptide (TPR) repeat protein
MATKTLLIAWEGADWSFLLPLRGRGIMPTLKSLMGRGVKAELSTHSPCSSPILWNSLVTGKRAWRHGIMGPAKLDKTGTIRPATPHDRRAPALWNIFSAEGRKTIVVGGHTSSPAESVNGVFVSDAYLRTAAKPGADGGPNPSTIFPSSLDVDLQGLLVKTGTLDPSVMRSLVPTVTPALARRDPRLPRLATYTAHLYSTHNVAASLLETEPWDLAVIYFDFFARILFEFGAFFPPLPPHVATAAVDRYGGILEGACRLQDLLLRDLLEAVGPDTRVFIVSPHGHRQGAPLPLEPPLPPELELNGRDGILVAAGPGITPTTGILSSASVLDITPTILQAAGLPIGDDMDGYVRSEMLIDDLARPVNRIPSWNERTKWPMDTSAEPANSQASGPAGSDGLILSKEAEALRIQNQWNEGIDLMNAGLALRALPLLEEAAWTHPEKAFYSYWLALCQSAVGLSALAWETAGALDDSGPAQPATERLKAILALENQQLGTALAQLEAASAATDLPGDLPIMKASVLQQSRRWLEALEILQAEAVSRPSSEVWMGLVKCFHALRNPRAAVAAARQYLRTAPDRFGAWVLLARGLIVIGETQEAWEALLEAHQIRPTSPEVLFIASRRFRDRRDVWGSWKSVGPAPNAKKQSLNTADIVRDVELRRAAWEKRQAAGTGSSEPAVGWGEPAAPPVESCIEAGGKTIIYRAIQPTEEKRALEILGNLPPLPGKPFIRVWETFAPRRFAGAASWSAPQPGQTEALASIRLRPGFCTPEFMTELVRPLFEEMRAAGCRKTRVMVVRKAGWEEAMAHFHLTCTKSNETWVGDAESSYKKAKIRFDKWQKQMPPDARVREVTDADWEFIAHECAAMEYMGADNFARVKRDLAGNISCIVELDTGPVGVLLATRRDTSAIMEYFGKSQKSQHSAAWITILAFVRFLRRDLPDAFDQFFASADAHQGGAGGAMLQRDGRSEMMQTVDHFTGEILL